jgi:hypothetical protein
LRPIFVTALLATATLPLRAAPLPSASPMAAPVASTAPVTPPVMPPVSQISAPALTATGTLPPNVHAPFMLMENPAGEAQQTDSILLLMLPRLTIMDDPAPICTSLQAPYRPGFWEITSVSTNSQMPQQSVTAKVKRCITERDTMNACGLNQFSGGRNHNCQITDMRIIGNQAIWTMTCNGVHLHGQGTGKSTFSTDAYHGTFEMNASFQGNSMKMSTTFTGKRLGNCK